VGVTRESCLHAELIPTDQAAKRVNVADIAAAATIPTTRLVAGDGAVSLAREARHPGAALVVDAAERAALKGPRSRLIDWWLPKTLLLGKPGAFAAQ
jgi:hypothetical protein